MTRLPDVVEARLGVREYWFETYRRAVFVPLPDGCTLFSIDVYTRDCNRIQGRVRERLSLGSVELDYVELEPSIVNGVLDARVEEAVALLLRTQNRCEVITVRLKVCGVEGYPPRDVVWQVYRRVVMAVEARDPAVSPLQTPPLED